MTKAFKSTHGVFTTLLTTAIVHTAFIYIWEEKGTFYNYILPIHQWALLYGLALVCVTLKLLCVAPITRCRLTSTVGQPIHGVAFVAQTLKTTGGVHTRVITCPLKKTFIYICNQNQAGDIIAGQSVAIFIRRDFPPTDPHLHLILNFPTSLKCDVYTMIHQVNQHWVLIVITGKEKAVIHWDTLNWIVVASGKHH